MQLTLLTIYQRQTKVNWKKFSTKPSGWAASHLEQRLARQYFEKNQGFLTPLNTTRNIKYNLFFVDYSFHPKHYLHWTNWNYVIHSACAWVPLSNPAFYLLSSLEQNILHIYICHMPSSRGHLFGVWHPQNYSGRMWRVSHHTRTIWQPLSHCAEIGEILYFVRLSFCEILFKGVKCNQNCFFSFGVVSFIVFFLLSSCYSRQLLLKNLQK